MNEQPTPAEREHEIMTNPEYVATLRRRVAESAEHTEPIDWSIFD